MVSVKINEIQGIEQGELYYWCELLKSDLNY